MTICNTDLDDLKAIKPATLRRVIEYMRVELGLSIYGHAADLDTGEMFGANMDYDIDAVIKLRKLFMNGDDLYDPRPK